METRDRGRAGEGRGKPGGVARRGRPPNPVSVFINSDPEAAIAEKKGLHPSGSVAGIAATVSGGKATFMEYARWSDDDRVQAMMHLWDEATPQARTYLNLDRLCQEIGIPGPEFVSLVVKLAMEHNRDVATMVYACAAPQIADRNIQEAKKPEGFLDRKMALEITGLLPTGRGIRINNNVLNAPGAMASSPQEVFRHAITVGAESAREEEP